MQMVDSAPTRQFRGRLARTMLMILSLVSLLPLILMGSMAYYRARSLLREQIFNLLSAVSTTQAQRISSEIATGRLMLSRTLHDAGISVSLTNALQMSDRRSPEFSGARQTILDGFQSVNYPKPFFNQFMVVKPDGLIHISTKRDWEGRRLADMPVTQKLFSEQRSIASNSLQPIYPETFVIASSIPLVDENGDAIAIILGISEPAYIRDILDRAIFFSSTNYLVTQDGVFMGINPYPNNMDQLLVLEAPTQLKNVIQAGFTGDVQAGVSEVVSFKEQPSIAAYNWLPDLEMGWVAEVPQASVYNQMNSLLVFAIVLIVTISVLMILIMWQATRRLFRPLRELANSVQRFAEGKWHQRMPVVGNDEVGLLAYSFNQMADDLTDLYQSLESKVEERTQQIQTAAEVSQVAITSANLDNLLQRTLKLVVERFYYDYAAVHLVEENGNFAVLRQVYGWAAGVHEFKGKRLQVDSFSLIGWVISRNQPRIDTLVEEENAFPQRDDLIDEAIIEAAVPIAVGDQVLGVLNVQSTRDQGFDDENLNELQNLANQIAPALRSFLLLESTQVNLQETSLLYQSSHQITQAETSEEVFQITRRTLGQTPFASAVLIPEVAGLQVVFSLGSQPGQEATIPKHLPVSKSDVEKHLVTGTPYFLEDLAKSYRFPAALLTIPRQFQCDTAVFIPVLRGGRLATLLFLGHQLKGTASAKSEWVLSANTLQPYINFIELVTTAMEKVEALENLKKGLSELQTVDNVGKAITLETDLNALFAVIHRQIDQMMGEVSLFIALYDRETNLIRIPYMVEQGEFVTVEPFPLGEGLTSLLINERKPLLIVEDTRQQAEALGAKVTGKYAKSWLGVPLLIGGEAIGAMVVQDIEKENRFNEDDQRLLSTLASQVAIAVRNTQLLESSRQQADRERLISQITDRIRRSTDVQSILETTAQELSLALGARRAQVEITVQPRSGSNGRQKTPGSENLETPGPETGA
jgi:transcriptional regulator with GAF, ATPase, and Fis domain